MAPRSGAQLNPKAKAEQPFSPSPRQEKILFLLRSRGGHHAASVAHIMNIAGGESAALAELKLLEKHGMVQRYETRGCLLWRATAPAA